jgi:hypothetical protein
VPLALLDRQEVQDHKAIQAEQLDHKAPLVWVPLVLQEHLDLLDLLAPLDLKATQAEPQEPLVVLVPQVPLEYQELLLV